MKRGGVKIFLSMQQVPTPRFYHHKLRGCPGPPAWPPSLPPDGFPVGAVLVSSLAVHWGTCSHLLFAQNEDNVAFYSVNKQYCTVAWVFFFLLRILLEIIVKIKIFKLPFSSSCIEVFKKKKAKVLQGISVMLRKHQSILVWLNMFI